MTPGREPAALEAALDALGPMLMADTFEEAAAHATRLLADVSGAEAAVLFLVSGKDTAAEFWVPGDEATRLRFRPHLRGLALESLAQSAPVLSPFPPEVAADLEPAVLTIADRGRTVALACLAGTPGAAERCAPVAAVVARQIARHEEAAQSQAGKARYERWFKQFDQQMRALERERQKFAALVNQSEIYVLTADRNRTVRWASRALLTRHPAPDPAGWLGRDCADLWAMLAGRPTAPEECPVGAALASGRPAHREFGGGAAQAGGYQVTALPIRDPEGRVSEVLVLAQDLSGLEVVRRMGSELQQIVSSAPLIVFSVDPAGVFRLSEGRALHELGLTPGEVVGRSAFDVYRDAPQVTAALRRALAGEEFTATVEASGRFFETRYVPQRDASGALAGVSGIATDVTDRRRLQERLRAAERNQVAGRVAACAAGEFGELLTVIMGNAELMLGQLGPGHPVRPLAAEVQRAGMRSAELVRQLRSIGRRGTVGAERLDADEALARAGDLLRRAAGGVELAIVPGTRPAHVRVERDQLEQALLDVVIQLRDRLPAGGRLVLERADVDPAPGAEARVEFRARAEGPAVLAREPGAAQREPAGLTLAQDLARYCGGDLLVEDEPGRAVTLRLRLPRCEAPATDEGSAPGSSLRLAA